MKPHAAIPVKDLNRSKMFNTMLGFAVIEEWQCPDWELKGCYVELPRLAFVQDPNGFSVELFEPK